MDPIRHSVEHARPGSRRSAVVGPAQHFAVAEHGHRTVFAHGDHGGERVIEAVATPGRVTGAAECLHGLFGGSARHQPHAEAAQHAVDVEEGGSIDLGEGVTERGEVRRER